MRNEEMWIQIKVVEYIRRKYPDALFTCAPATAKSVQQGVKNKRMGLRKGWPDLFIAEPRNGRHGLFLELKTQKGKVSPEQSAILNKANELGYSGIAVYSYEEAVETINSYMK